MSKNVGEEPKNPIFDKCLKIVKILQDSLLFSNYIGVSCKMYNIHQNHYFSYEVIYFHIILS